MNTRDSSVSGMPYRSRDGAIAGVCRGLAEYFDFSVFWLRIIFVLGAVFTGLWPAVAGYVLAALLMKPEPLLPPENMEEEEFYRSYTGSRSMAVQRLKRTFDSLDRRIQRIESIVTKRGYDWDKRLDEAGRR